MAGEHTESDAHASDTHDSDLAAFLARDSGETVDAAEVPDTEAADDDADLEADTDPDADIEAKADEDDPDADLKDDEDEEEPAKDAETAKRLEQVRRTDRRLREQREQAFSKREAELDAREQQIASEMRPHFEKLEKFEKAAQRVGVDPAGVLLSLGLTEDRFEHAAQVLYTLAKSKDDPKAKAAVAQLMKDRERDEEIEKLKKRDLEREESEKQRARQAEADRQLDAYFGKVTKAVSDKTPLVAAFMKSNPTAARERLEVVAFNLAQGTGKLPSERAVVIELEKDRRRILRDLGIDPKTVTAKKATAAIEASQDKPVTKAKKPTVKPAAPANDDNKPMTKDEFIRMGRS